MCGIAGFNWRDEPLLRKMTGTIHYRGPDANGHAFFDSMSLGNVRLSIIDLSTKANQPMFSRNGKLCIVYNGEIYNFPEIKKELMEKGHVFQTHSDTEVVLRSYEAYGPDCLKKFNGIFAFAIWDEKKKELFLARDRLGIKPLYYYFKDGKFLFASEIKSILESDVVSKQVHLESLYYYLGYEFVPAPHTMFENIYKLSQGHYALFRNHELKTEKYWDISFRPSLDMDEEEMAEKVFSAVERAVKMQLISDVPVGVFLSGGLDSSTVTGFAARFYPRRLQAFSIGYEDKTFSELPYAKQVSDFFGTEHHILMINPISPEDIEESLYHLDEPMTDLSTIPFHLICKKARESVKVCLSGEGGDEVFLGYDRFKAARINRIFHKIPSWIRNRLLVPLVMKLPDQPQKKGAINMLKRFVEGSLYPEKAGAMRWQYFLTPGLASKLLQASFQNKIQMNPFDPIYAFHEFCDSDDPEDMDTLVDLKLTMADSVLMKVDKMSMATSLEVRVPLLDHELVELCARIPASSKMKGLKTKSILRKALSMHRFLPENIIHRGKQGYSLPIKNWLREELRPFMQDLLSNSPLILENFNQETVQTLIQEHLAKKHNHNHILWALINAALWYKRFYL
ncbi:MAG: asparagine synthase (glutamine-hydrolyzing) [Candidatus Aureabacteria bacterium]|nr:asparagine synthase (glutamine-hydrolyzing) [Candidatus Auribacterota bacterium]